MNVGQLINHNSYAITAAAVLIAIGLDVIRREVTVRSIGIVGLLAVALVLPVLWLRSPGGAAEAVDGALASGKPVLVEVYSDF